jgi:HEAT repeat protein
MAAKRSVEFTGLPDEEIRKLVDSLSSLHEGELGVSALIACGPRAVPPLREFLLHGRPAGIFEPRCRAVRALAEIGEKDVLLEYLTVPRAITDPVIRLGEEAVENTAARALAKWPTDEVFRALLSILADRSLPGVIETVASFRRPVAIPYFIRALEDDVGRRPAEDALRVYGVSAYWALLEAVLTPVPSDGDESPSSRLRRRSALRLMAELQLSRDGWPAFRILLDDFDQEIAFIVAKIALRIGPAADRQTAAQRLINALASDNWLVRMEAEDCLVENFSTFRDLVGREIARREAAASRNDTVLAGLHRLQHRANTASVSRDERKVER